MRQTTKQQIATNGTPYTKRDWAVREQNNLELIALIEERFPGQREIDIPEEFQFVRSTGVDPLIAQKLVKQPRHKGCNHWLLRSVSEVKGQVYGEPFCNLEDEMFARLLDWISPEQPIEHPDGMPIYGRDHTNNTLIPGVYLCLFHGYRSQLDRWRGTQIKEEKGVDGPMIGPLEYVHTSYAQDVKYAFADHFFEATQRYGLDDEGQLEMVEDCLLYNGIEYGDWSVSYFPK